MEEGINFRITSKGEAFGLEMMVPLYMQVALFIADEDKPTLAGFVAKMDKVFERGRRRSMENEDGTLSAADAVQVGEVWRLYEVHKNRVEDNRHKL